MAIDTDFERACRQADLYTGVTGVPCVVLDIVGRVVHPVSPDSYPCRLCRTVSGRREGGEPHLPWLHQAIRFGGQSIFLCENAFTHWTAPIIRNGVPVGGLVAGPVLMIEDQEFFELELAPRIAERGDGGRSQVSDLRMLFEQVPRLQPDRVKLLAELLSQLARALCDDQAGAMDEAAAALEQQSRLNEYIQALKEERARAGGNPEEPSYPLETEERLLRQIRAGELKGAQKSLNELLSHVFFASGSEMDRVKLRSRELVVLLSRAVVAEGADPEEVFGLNFQFVDAIDRQEDINGIAYWMARIVRRFADFILYLPNRPHARALRRAIAYLRQHSAAAVRVADVAEAAGMSISHFSRVFHAEMGESVVGYLTRIRLESAAELLRATDLPVVEVAGNTGFSDHSYFTKVFRRHYGVTPSRYRGMSW